MQNQTRLLRQVNVKLAAYERLRCKKIQMRACKQSTSIESCSCVTHYTVRKIVQTVTPCLYTSNNLDLSKRSQCIYSAIFGGLVLGVRG